VKFMVGKVSPEQVSLKTLRISLPVSIIPSIRYTHLHLHVTLTRKTNRRSLGTFKNAMLFPKSRNSG